MDITTSIIFLSITVVVSGVIFWILGYEHAKRESKRKRELEEFEFKERASKFTVIELARTDTIQTEQARLYNPRHARVSTASISQRRNPK